MRLIFRKRSLLLLTGIILAFSACEKQDTTVIDGDTDAAVENTLSESYFDVVYRQVNTEALGSNELNLRNSGELVVRGSAGCAESVTITTTNGSFPKTMTINYTNNVCNGHTLNGKIITVFTGRYRDSATVITTHFENFTIDGNQIHGLKTITNKGLNDMNHPHFTVEVDTASIVTPRGIINWESDRTIEWIVGYDTPANLLDDEYKITGTSNGTSWKGNTYTTNITKALWLKAGCRYITEGIIVLTSQAGRTLSIDYGDGTCDDKAVVTINNKNKVEITLN